MTERTITETGRADLGFGLALIQNQHEGVYHWNKEPYSYQSHSLEGLDGDTAVEDLCKLADVMKNLPADGALSMDEEDLLEFLKDQAQSLVFDAESIADELGLSFTVNFGTYGMGGSYTGA